MLAQSDPIKGRTLYINSIEIDKEMVNENSEIWQIIICNCDFFKHTQQWFLTWVTGGTPK